MVTMDHFAPVEERLFDLHEVRALARRWEDPAQLDTCFTSLDTVSMLACGLVMRADAPTSAPRPDLSTVETSPIST